MINYLVISDVPRLFRVSLRIHIIFNQTPEHEVR